MHGHRRVDKKDDPRTVYVDGKPTLEYDYLRTGELAWILGRRIKSNGEDLSETERYSHQAYIGLGNGVDRMQRLASTNWVENMLQDKLGSQRIDLHNLRLDSLYAVATSDLVGQFQPYLAGATVMTVPDVTWWHSQITQDAKTYDSVGYDPTGDPDSGRKLQGLNVMETGPFLRGIQVSDGIVRFEKTVPGYFSQIDLPRNLGDNLAFSVLESELRRHHMMDWTPDGIVLSKLESPTDEPMKSIEMDARSAQLFNVGVQGPAVTTAWTSDVRDYKLEVQPMDKVFICLVATLAYRVTQDLDSYGDLKTAQNQVLEAMAAYKEAIDQRQPDSVVTTASSAFKNAVVDAENAATTYTDDINLTPNPEFLDLLEDLEVKKAAITVARALSTVPPPALKVMEQQVAEAQSKCDDYFQDTLTEDEKEAINDAAQFIRTGKATTKKVVLTNFRLMRSTSSHMSNYSYPRPGEKASRLGLKISSLNIVRGDIHGAADYIVGAWCIGTVADSAASRSTVGSLVRTAPTSMAINVNVNVKWVSGDQLYKAYMDKGGLTTMRGQHEVKKPDGTTRKRQEIDDDAVTAAVADTIQNPAYTPTGNQPRQVPVAGKAPGVLEARGVLDQKRKKLAPAAPAAPADPAAASAFEVRARPARRA